MVQKKGLPSLLQHQVTDFNKTNRRVSFHKQNSCPRKLVSGDGYCFFPSNPCSSGMWLHLPRSYVIPYSHAHTPSILSSPAPLRTSDKDMDATV